MPRKAFIADLQAAIATSDLPQISHIQAGDEDGSFNFVYHMMCNEKSTDISIHVLIPDVSEYPKNHQCLLYTTSDHIPKKIAQAIEELRSINSLRISELLRTVLKKLTLTTELHALETSMTRIITDTTLEDGDEDPLLSSVDEMEDNWSEHSIEPWSSYSPLGAGDSMSEHSFGCDRGGRRLSAAMLRLCHDLRTAKNAGFKIGCYGDLKNGNDTNTYLTISLRIHKLAISDEVLQAWGLTSRKYLVLMINYSLKYQGLECLLLDLANKASSNVLLRVGICKTYKPSYAEVKKAFHRQVGNQSLSSAAKPNVESASTTTQPRVPATPGANTQPGTLERTFIEDPLNELLNSWLLPLISLRVRHAISWSAAEAHYYDFQKRGVIPDVDFADNDYHGKTGDETKRFPEIVTADHLKEEDSILSFPLVAMQFLLRRVLRCPEYCLVCHCKMESQFEALKPYVCSNPLCLYQYMTLGFGPSIEFEITSSPNVADLLVSFCYFSAQLHRLNDFPNGMNLMVPKLKKFPIDTVDLRKEDAHSAQFDRKLAQLTFSKETSCPLKPKDWVLVIITKTSWAGFMYHCRVADMSSFPVVQLSTDMVSSVSMAETPGRIVRGSPGSDHSPQAMDQKKDTFEEPFSALVIPYAYSFDSLDLAAKRCIIPFLLETLPSIGEMVEYLRQNSGRSLRHWHERISPAALGILRWIIASNRSCIVEVENDDINTQITPGSRSEQRVRGMENWVQFRFAQGAPDKEARFQDSVESVTKRLGLKYPTIFAWHGSRLENWHGIVREGLNFNETLNGRAFGHGVYHSLNYQVSIGYSTAHQYIRCPSTSWPHSSLKVRTAICLNEIVNAPQEFVRSNPHLVVSQLDWIQTRFLFVKCDNPQIPTATVEPDMKKMLKQDPSKHLQGESGPILIPLAAVKKVPRYLIKSVKKGNKKAKISLWRGTNFKGKDKAGARANDESDDGLISDATDPEDIEILTLDEVNTNSNIQSPGEKTQDDNEPAHASNLTEYTSRQLKAESLPLLNPPSYATPIATKTLQRELQAILKVQDAEPLHRRGWSLDPELVQNVYQWIVELHSFDTSLPLARDMQDRKVQSIVLEMRFGPGYPMSPPFIRVIRPRFLPFMSGGGGHVTAGGALCMELLTNSGWSAVSSIESVLVQVRVAISSLEPRPARLEAGVVRDYHIGEAVAAYIRACRTHGWQVPKEFDQFIHDKGS